MTDLIIKIPNIKTSSKDIQEIKNHLDNLNIYYEIKKRENSDAFSYSNSELDNLYKEAWADKSRIKEAKLWEKAGISDVSKQLQLR